MYSINNKIPELLTIDKPHLVLITETHNILDTGRDTELV